MDDKALASRLQGKKVGKWNVIEKRRKDDKDNSGYFSTCYTVEDDNGNKAFLKAFNYIYAFGRKSNSADVLKLMTENFTYERDLLNFCSDKGMTHVVTAIDSGEYREEGEILSAPYLIFEIAQGSLKTHAIITNPNIAWKLKAFHNALVGLSQLHAQKIVHQDIKPSNILIFGQFISKISDLGSATMFTKPSNWQLNAHAGDMNYAPIELCYGYCSPNWETRRCGADLFMMGGILSYMLTGTNYLCLLCSKLPSNKQPFQSISPTFDEVKTLLLHAHNETLIEIEPSLPKNIQKDLIDVLSQLCHPIPEDRGNPKRFTPRISQYSLQRYISIIDRLSKKAILYSND